MRIILRVTNDASGALGADRSRTFGEQGGTIGRGSGNDWVLPDPERVLSGRHAAIFFQDGAFHLADTSANGVFLNGAEEPVGSERMVRLNDGDRLLLGDYEMVVGFVAQAAGATPESLDPLALLDGDAPRREASTSPPPAGRANIIPDSLDPMDLLHGDEPPIETPAASSIPDHAPTLQTSFKPPEAIPEGWDEPPMESPAPLTPAPAPSPPAAAAGPPLAAEPHARGPADAPEISEPIAVQSELSAARPAPASTEAPPSVPIAGAVGTTAQQWYVRRGGKVKGPFSETVIKRSVERGRLLAADELSRDGEHWQTLAALSQGQLTRDRARPPPPDMGVMAGLCEGAGIDPAALRDRDPAEFATLVGRILRLVVEDLREVLMARAELKSGFRMDVTLIRPKMNNPLKFSAGGVDDAIDNLLLKRGSGYLPPLEAFHEGFADLKDHQVAMMAGMRATFTYLLERFDPERLAEEFERGGKAGPIFGSMKARYWELYEQLHEDLSKQAEDDFQDVFGNTFAEAYEAQSRKLEQARKDAKK
jgi:type VI secretion system FHA domain protein